MREDEERCGLGQLWAVTQQKVSPDVAEDLDMVGARGAARGSSFAHGHVRCPLPQSTAVGSFSWIKTQQGETHQQTTMSGRALFSELD